MALTLTVNTHTTDGNQSLCSITSMHVESDLGRAWEEFHMLAVHLWELAPDHAIFEVPAFTDKQWMTWSPLALRNLKKCMVSTRRPETTAFFRAVSFGGCPKPRCHPTKKWKRRLLSPHSADEPAGWGEWGGAGIVRNLNPLFWAPTGGMIKVQPHLLLIMVLMGRRE